jgi:hypothetical protein
MIKQQGLVFKAKEHLDKKFASKFLLAVDTPFQMWLKQRRIAKNRSDIDDSIPHKSHYWIYKIYNVSQRTVITLG